MPNFTSSEEWQAQSALLLKARPSTTRIVTKYHIPNLSSPRHEKKLAARKAKPSSTSTDKKQPEDNTSPPPPVARAYLELKTYDPESGTCLKYKTDKAAEVGRLIGGLGRLARHMAALPELKDDDVEMKDVVVGAESGVATPAQAEPGAPVGEAAAVQNKAQQQGGGGKKKKKGGKK